MRLLAWDTSSKAGALVAMEWQEGERPRLLGEWALNVDATHSDRLLWGIHRLLESCYLKLADIDVFGVGVGPGSFTGLRIGLTTARTLAHTLGKPLVGVSSLAALARPAALALRESASKALLVATTDAAKGELFSLYGPAASVADCVILADGDHPGLWKRGVQEEVMAPEDLIRAIRAKLKNGAKWIALGEGRSRYLEIWRELPHGRELEPPFPFSDHVQGRYLGVLAWEAFQAGLARKALQVRPRYIRASDAEVKLRAGLLKPAPRGPA